MKKIKIYSIIYTAEDKERGSLCLRKERLLIMEKEIIFEDYNIKFTKEELKQVDKKTLKKCKKILQKTLVKLGN